MLAWQQFIVGSLHGWVNTTDDTRRFRVAYIETAKGSGKSPLAAGLGIYALVADGEARAEVYAAATKKDQAMVLFRDAIAMYDHSPALQRRLTTSGTGVSRWNLAYHATASFFRPISADDGQSGPRPHHALLDEIHEHKTDAVVEMMRAGTKSRRQALIFMITNAGAGRSGPCWNYHDYACKVAAGTVNSGERGDLTDTFFSYVASLDDDDDPIHDETCWPKANPSLQHANLPGLKYLREQVAEARGMPSKESLVRRLNFCQWTDAANPWLTPDVWKRAQRDYTLDQFRGRRAYAGLDLSSTTDLTALVLNIEPIDPGEPWHLIAFAWLPEEDLAAREERDRVPYTAWKRAGHLLTTPGRAISKLHVIKHLIGLMDIVEILLVAYDRWRIKDFQELARDNDITLPPLLDFGQGYKSMSPAIEKLEAGLMGLDLDNDAETAATEQSVAHEPAIVHNGHPLLTWCASNVVPVKDPTGARKFDKERAIGRIDVAIAAVMAVGCSGKAEVTLVPRIIDLEAA